MRHEPSRKPLHVVLRQTVGWVQVILRRDEAKKRFPLPLSHLGLNIVGNFHDCSCRPHPESTDSRTHGAGACLLRAATSPRRAPQWKARLVRPRGAGQPPRTWVPRLGLGLGSCPHSASP